MAKVTYLGPSNRFRIPRDDEDIVLRRGFEAEVPEDLVEGLAELRGEEFEVDGEELEAAPQAQPLEKLTVDELHELADEHEVDISSDANKALIVSALEAAGVNAPDA